MVAVYPAAVLRKQLVSATSAAQAGRRDGSGLLMRSGDDGRRIVGQQILAAQRG